MNPEIEGATKLSLKKDDILFLAEENEKDLFIIERGKVMVFVQKGSQIIPLAYLGEGEFIGELTFFDQDKRSASIICTEDSDFIKISVDQLHQHCPAHDLRSRPGQH